MTTNNSKIRGYKGLNADWTCRGMQYEVGKTYTHDGPLSLCSSGLHFCECPLDVFAYYPPTGRIAVVEAVGVSNERGEVDSKRVAKSLTIEASLSIAELVSASIEYTTRNADPVKTKHAKGYQSAASTTGYRSAASATGYQSAASTTGCRSAASTTGYRSAASATGYQGAASTTGDMSAASATGDRSAASTTGYQSAASATGDQSAASATGYDAVAAAFGLSSTATAGDGGIVVLAWHDGARKRMTVGYVGENGIEAGVAYRCDDAGKLVRA